MNILFVTMVPLENNSSATIQNKGIIKGFYELGHSIDIITLKPNSKTLSYDESMNDLQDIIKNKYYIEPDSKYAALMNKKTNNQNKHNDNYRSNRTIVNIKNKVRSLIKNVFDNISIFDAQKSNVKQVSKLELDYNIYDLIVSSSDPKSSHLIVNKIIKDNPNTRSKWIQYWGDPMFNDITRKKDWRDKIVKYQEKKLINKADKIMYASPLTLRLQKETYPDQAYKMDYANQVFLNYVPNNNSKDLKNNIVRIGYFGTFYSKFRDIKPLYNAALSSNYNLNICGASDLKIISTENITIHGLVPYKEALRMEEDSDILVTICNKFGTQIPGKIYYCAGYAKSIIVILDCNNYNELREYLETFDRYIICENNESSITNAIEEARKQLSKNKYQINEQLTPRYMGNKILDKIFND